MAAPLPTTNAEFRALLLGLQSFFANEPAAVSVETERFGTVTREALPGLLALTEARADQAEVAS